MAKTVTINLTAPQKAALVTAYQNITQFVDSAQFQKVMEVLRSVSPAKRDALIESYDRLKKLIELGEKLRVR